MYTKKMPVFTAKLSSMINRLMLVDKFNHATS